MLGQVRATLEQANHMELAIGTKTRSAGQFDIWEAVYRSETSFSRHFILETEQHVPRLQARTKHRENSPKQGV
jgi:hypothetical protein